MRPNILWFHKLEVAIDLTARDNLKGFHGGRIFKNYLSTGNEGYTNGVGILFEGIEH